MYGDTARVRAQGARLRAIAMDVRFRASDVVAAGDVDWLSIAADRYRTDLADKSAELHRVADEIDEAAAALSRHAAAVDKVKAEIAAAERWVREEAAKARSVVTSAVDAVVNAVADAVASAFRRAHHVLTTVHTYDLPPGSTEWLLLRDVVSRL